MMAKEQNSVAHSSQEAARTKTRDAVGSQWVGSSAVTSPTPPNRETKRLDLGARVGFTATRRLVPGHHARMLEVLARGQGKEFTTGGAPGGDQLIAETLYRLRPDAHHRIVLPRLQENTRSHHAYAEGRARTHELVRTDVVLDHSDRLIAFPLHEEHHDERSGTWATVRQARKRGIPVEVHILEPLEGEDVGLAPSELHAEKLPAEARGPSDWTANLSEPQSAGMGGRDHPDTNADCYQLATHRGQWSWVVWCFGLRARWVCPVCHPEDFAGVKQA